MRKFLIRSSLFGVLIIVTLFAGEYAARSLPNPYKYKHQWMQHNGKRVETLILGSSHAYFGIAPLFLPKNTFSLANSSQNLKYDYLLLEHYAKQYENLRQVIVPISYFSFFSEGFENKKDWWYAINYKLYMDINVYSDFSKYNFEISHLSVYSGKIQSLFSDKKLMCDSLGQGKDYLLENKAVTWENTATEAVKRHTFENWDMLDENSMHLRKIIDFCENRSLSLVLVTTPTWHSYYEKLDKKQLDKMYEIIYTMQKKYNFSYYDYLKDSRFMADDFYDCDHLSSDIGAEKFAKILRKDIWKE